MISNTGWPSPKAREGLPVWRVNRLYALILSKIEIATDETRKIPLVWSLMHMFSTTQLGKLLALKRGINPELAALTCALHDVYTLFTGLHKDHGIKAEKIIREYVAEFNASWRDELPEITSEELEQIIGAIAVHSDKEDISDNPLIELLKDADTLDSYLDGFTQNDNPSRILRANTIFKELMIDHLLDD